MSAFQHIRLAAVLFIVATAAHVARAQQDCECSPFYGCENDLQWFDPVEFELDCSLPEPCGFFYHYQRTYWSLTGHRTLIGDPNATQETYNPYPSLGLQGDGVVVPFGNSPLPPPLDAIQPVQLVNSVHNSAPRARFALGHRHEFGYYQDNRGWLISFTDPGDHITSLTLGLEGGEQSHPATPDLASPFGDVVVNFATPVGYMAGFVDIMENTLFNNIPGGRILPADTNGDGILDGDGFADDMDGDGIYGPDGIDTDGDGDPDTANPGGGLGLGNVPDYDDLVLLPTSFNTLTATNRTFTRSFELMRRLRLDNSHFMKKRQHNSFEIFYGARFMEFDDHFVVNADGGVLGLSQWDTRIDNQIVGPQVAYKWNHRRGRWILNSQGRALFGYNIQDWTQDGFVGEDLVPGALNHPLFSVANSFNHGRQRDEFSPVGELRLEAAYLITENVQLKAGWTGTYIGGLNRASDSVRYELPTMGFVNGSTDSVFLNGINFGFEITQ